MKYFSLVFSLLFTLSIFSQNWGSTSPIPVATGFGKNHPQIELAGDGLPLVTWTGNYNVYIAKHDGVSGFNAPVQLNPTGFDVQDYSWSGPDIAIEGSNVYVIWRSLDFEFGHVYFQKSTDNGVTFSDTVRVDDLSIGFGQYPDIAVFQDTLWATFMHFEAGSVNPQYVVTRSFDGGATWQPEVAAGAILGAEACECCQPEIMVNDELVIVIFRNNDNDIRDMKAVVSYDRGASFADWISVDDHNWNISACPSVGADASFTNGNDFIVVYKTNYLTEDIVSLNEYDFDGGTSVGQTNMEADGYTNDLDNYPQLAYADDVLGVVWEAKGDGLDIFINSSSSGSAGLNSAEAFNLTNSPGSQAKPDIAIGNGLFHVVYTDYTDNDIKYVQLDRFTEVEDQQTDLIQFYPNPTTDQFTIELLQGQFGDLKIYAVTGELILNHVDISNKTIISTTNWNKGVYIVSIEVENELIFRKITIQ